MSQDYREQLLTPGVVAALFRVDPKTVQRWADQGLLTTTRTLGGHRRFHRHEIEALLRQDTSRGAEPNSPVEAHVGPSRP